MFETIKKAWSSFSASPYVATEKTNRRKTSASVVKSEDEILKPADRKQLISETHFLRRNFAVARWAIRKHLDFVANHNFAAKTEDGEFNKRLEKYLAKRAKRVDVSGRFTLRRFTRMVEASALVDGDVWLLRRRDAKYQPIEADRVRDPANIKTGETWFHGVKVSKTGAPAAVAIYKRLKGRQEYERTVSASKLYQHGYFDRFDQYRGVSPFACVVNELKDFREGLDYAAARDKINQLFALAIYRDGDQGWGTSEKTGDSSYEVDFGKGPIMLDLDPGDKAEFLSTKSPASESIEFWRMLLQVSLKAIDLPYSFFSEDFTNFFGSRSALILYLKSCDEKRRRVQEFLDDWTLTQIRYGVLTGELVLPAGVTEDEIAFKWIPDGVAWWNPIQEVKADVISIAAGLRTRGEIILERTGRDYRDVMDGIAFQTEVVSPAKGF